MVLIMPKIANRLNDKQIKSIAAKKPSGLYSVGGVSGLSLQVKINPLTDTRTASWILRIKIGNKRRSIGLGGYKGSQLSKIRGIAEHLRYDIKFKGLDPFQERANAKVEALENKAAKTKLKTFKQVAEVYIDKKSIEYKTHKQTKRLISQLEDYAYPYIGDFLIKDIEISHIVDMLSHIWLTKHETANRTRVHVHNIFKMAIADKTYTEASPADWNRLSHFLVKPSKIHTVKHRESLSVEQMPKLFGLVSNSENQSAKLLSFVILTASRFVEGSKAQWNEIDLINKVWTKPPAHTKNGEEHRVPLSKQAIKLLKSMPKDHKLIFPSSNNNPLSDVAVTKAHRKHGFKGDTNSPITTHGFRSTFKDWARTLTNYPDELSEIQIHHKTGDSTHQAYARDDLLEKRRQLVEDWANYCQKGKKVGGDNVRAIGA